MNYKINKMPEIALGTWEVTDPSVIDSIIPAAFDAGYKHIDTAQLYFNEEMIGATLAKIGKERQDFWITTKITPPNFTKHAYLSIEKSLERLQTDYVDTILLHSPISNEGNLIAFKEALKARDNGLVRFVGVSNFSIEQIEYLYEKTGEYPKYNQVIASVIQRITEMEEFAKEKGITLMGYSSIRPYYNPNIYYKDSALTDDERKVVDQIAKTHNVTPAIILQSFIKEMGYVILPKSVKPERVKQNYQAMSINFSNEELEALKGMNRFSEKSLTDTMDSWKSIMPFEDEAVQKMGARISPESDAAMLKLFEQMQD